MDGTLKKKHATATHQIFIPDKTQNRIDTRQRVFSTIDTSYPHGDWVEEPAFNRSQTTHGVLSGNWMEERIVSEEAQQLAHMGINTLYAQDKKDRHVKATSSVAFHKDFMGVTNGLFLDAPSKGSSIKNQQTCTIAHRGVPPNEQLLNTTHRETFKAPNHSSMASIGARQQMIERQLYMQALELQENEIGKEESEHNEGVKKSFATTYLKDHCNNEGKLLQRDGKLANSLTMTGTNFAQQRERYDTDVPITIYSDAIRKPDEKLKTHIYHSATTGRNPFARNADFSTPISEYSKKGNKL